MDALQFPQPANAQSVESLRHEVRAFLGETLGGRDNNRRSYSYLGEFDPEFSAALGRRGWIGMGIPRRYGGRECGIHERYVIFEELLAARAPLYAHAIAERQSAPLLLRYGTERQREDILPRIVNGTCYFCIGMSEADSGSDLASVRTRADKVDGGFLINGAKIWTSSAHRAHYMILLCRTSPRSENRHEGLSQILIDMSSPGITCRPIINMANEYDFNEVHFNDVFVADDMVIGKVGEGWLQVTSELAFERSGPERYLSALGLVEELADLLMRSPLPEGHKALGAISANLYVLRRLSRSVATMLDQGAEPALQAALLKDLGTSFEKKIPEMIRLVASAEPDSSSADPYVAALANVLVRAPSCTIRGGTTEVLRSMIARGLGLR